MPDNTVERWCNQVAAELLVPLSVLRREYNVKAELPLEAERLARRFKVSTLVISTFEGRTSFTEAFRLLGFKKMATLREVGRSLGVGP